MKPDDTRFVLFRCYAAGRPRPMREDCVLSIVSSKAQDFSNEDPEGTYLVVGVVLHEEGREVTLEAWEGGRSRPVGVYCGDC